MHPPSKIERALAEQELAVLHKRLSLLKSRASRMSKFIVVWLLIAVAVYTYFYFEFQRDDLRMLLLVVACYAGIGVWIVIEDSFRRRKVREDIKYVENHTVTVYAVNSDRFLLLEEEEDEGCHYIFEVSANELFFFGGQDFNPSKNFPSDNFEIVEGRNKDGEVILQEIYNYGRKIQPLKTIKGLDKWPVITKNKLSDPATPNIAEGRIEDFIDL